MSTGNKAAFAKFVIKNSLKELPEEEVFTRTCNDGEERTYRYKWHVYLNVVGGDPGIIARVEVDMGPTFQRKSQYVENRPRKILVRRPEGEQGKEESDVFGRPRREEYLWRCFESRQTCWGWPGTIRFKIIGIRGTILSVKYDAHGDRSEVIEGHFCEDKPVGPSHLKPLPLPSHLGFGIQLLCEIKEPLSILATSHGEEGLKNVRDKLSSYSDIFDQPTDAVVSVFLSATPSLEGIRKVALNFIKYEAAIDELFHKCRERTKLSFPSTATSAVAKSNCDVVPGNTNKEKHEFLIACGSIDDLVEALNPSDGMTVKERYKLTLFKDSEDFALQFFFPQILGDVKLLDNFIRLSVLFVHNSIRFRRPKSLKSDRTIDEQIDFLFENVVRDRFVEEALLPPIAALADADQTTLMNLSDCVDGLSLPESVAGTSDLSVPLDVFCSALDSDSQVPDRKRPRGAILESNNHLPSIEVGSPSSVCNDFMTESPRSTPSAASLRPMFRRHVEDERNFTSDQLTKILKKLSMRVGNQKSKRLNHLDRYFESRSMELEHLTDKIIGGERSSLPNGIVGFELVLRESAASNFITMILRGGKKASRLRVSVDIAKQDGIQLEDLSEEEIVEICSKLGIPPGAVNIDAYIDDLPEKPHVDEINFFCCFALVHDLPCTI